MRKEFFVKTSTVSKICLLFLISFSILNFSGCSGQIRQDSPAGLHHLYYKAGESVQARPIICEEIGGGREKVFIISTIHGDEPAGTQLAIQLSRKLRKKTHLLDDKQVVIVAVANPDGMANNKRGNIRGVDLNRNFQTKNRKNTARYGRDALCEPESRVLKKLILKYKPSRILSIHQPFGCIDWDGKGREIAERMSEFCELRASKVGARPGSLGSYAGIELGIPIITFELKANDHLLPNYLLWKKYGKAMLAFVSYPDDF